MNFLLRVAMVYIFVTLFSFVLVAQNYRYPLNVPMSLSGNYGELRGNHFHGGIDFRVGGVVGAPVYATEDGYISRISVSPTGYGNALYITHNNGFVSVYGHLHNFRDDIAKYVRDKQYAREEFKQDLYLSSSDFPVKKGDFIAKAGNTGSSGGPHLHFEIRDTENTQTDVFARNFISVTDNTPPQINSVAFYSYSMENGVPQTYLLTQRTTPQELVRVSKDFYVAIDAYDKQAGTPAKLAVSDYKVYFDGNLVYHFNLNEVPLSKNKYINSLIEFERKANRGKAMIKSYVEPGNILAWTNVTASNNGIISLNDTLEHKVKVEVNDIKNNKSYRVYTVKRNDNLLNNLYPTRDTLRENFIGWFLPGYFKCDGLDVSIPLCALYSSIYLKVDSLPTRVLPYAPVWKIHTPEVPLHYPMEIAISCDLPDTLAANAFLIAVSNSGKYSYAGGSYDVGKRKVVGTVGSFGNYSVGVDIVPPTISSSINNNAVIKGNSVSFILRDNLSGINRYRVEIDGHWVLAEYDAKNRRLSVPLERAKIKKGVKHNLIVKVWDNVNNVSTLKRSFTW